MNGQCMDIRDGFSKDFFATLQHTIYKMDQSIQPGVANIHHHIQNLNLVKMGDPSVNSQVYQFGDSHVLKTTKFNKKDLWRSKQFINSRLCELYLKNNLCQSISPHFNVANCEFMTYVEGEFVYGYVIEPMMKGQTLNSYLKKEIEEINKNGQDKELLISKLDKVLVNIMLIILEILAYLENQLHFYHNDFHDSNIFLAEDPSCYKIGETQINLPFTLKLFDYDWSAVGDAPHELFIIKMYEFVSLCKADTKCIEKNLVCNQNAIDKNEFTIKKDCEFFAQHWKWGKFKTALAILQGSTAVCLNAHNSNVDLARILLYIIQNFTIGKIEIQKHFPLFVQVYNDCNAANFNIGKSLEKVLQSKAQFTTMQDCEMSISNNNSQCTDYMSISCPNSQAADGLSPSFYVGGRHQATNRNRAKKSSKRRC